MSDHCARTCAALSWACVLTLAGSLLWPDPARAVICTNAGAGANSGTDNAIGTATACGLDANASGVDSSAYGLNSQASGTASSAYGVGSTASGESSSAFGNASLASGNVGSAFGALSTASANGSSAYGFASTASGPGSSAYGTSSIASGFNSSAYGFDSAATGASSVAIGDVAKAGGDNSIAIGQGATAAFTNSAAYGAGATATRANQQVFGTASNTYTAPGVTSDASKAAQGAPTHIVTTNLSGDLAAHTPDQLGLGGTTIDISANPSITKINNQITTINNQITILRQNDRKLMDGIAATLALSQPVMPWGKTAALNIGWGNFEGANGVGVTGALVLAPNWNSTAVVIHGGVGAGTETGSVTTRAGVTFAW